MKIALVYHQLRIRGGLEGYLLGFGRALLVRGHDVHVITARVDPAARGEIPGARIHLAAPRRVFKTAQMLRFNREAASLAGRIGFDAVLGFGRTTRQDIHRAGGGCHRVYSRMLPARKRLRPKNRAELKLEEMLYRGGQTRCFVVNSEMVARELEREYAVDSDRITVIRTAVDADVFSPDPSGSDRAAVRRDRGVSARRPVLLFVSHEHRRKGLDALLEAVADSDWELWIAGAPLGSAHRRRIAAPDLDGRVQHVGSSGDIVPLFRAADVFVHPTLYDACANAVLQSMACELPGVISTRDGAAEFIEDGVTGFRLEEPENPRAIRRAVERVLSLSPADRSALGAAARQRVAPLTWDAHVDAWIELIDSLGIAGRTAPS